MDLIEFPGPGQKGRSPRELGSRPGRSVERSGRTSRPSWEKSNSEKRLHFHGNERWQKCWSNPAFPFPKSGPKPPRRRFFEEGQARQWKGRSRPWPPKSAFAKRRIEISRNKTKTLPATR